MAVYIDVSNVDELHAHLGEMLAQLRAAGIEAISGPESHENGKFA